MSWVNDAMTTAFNVGSALAYVGIPLQSAYWGAKFPPAAARTPRAPSDRNTGEPLADLVGDSIDADAPQGAPDRVREGSPAGGELGGVLDG